MSRIEAVLRVFEEVEVWFLDGCDACDERKGCGFCWIVGYGASGIFAKLGSRKLNWMLLEFGGWQIEFEAFVQFA